LGPIAAIGGLAALPGGDEADKLITKLFGHSYKAQFERRNLDKFQRIELVAKLEPLLKAKENQAHGKTGPGKTLLTKSSEVLPIDIREELAKAAGVGTTTVYEGLRVLGKGAPELQEMVKSGKGRLTG
jgi:hypothetical protein